MPTLSSRDEYIEYLEAVSSGDKLLGIRPRANLVKSYITETVRNHHERPNTAYVLASAAGLAVDDLGDGSMFRLSGSNGVVAVVEGTHTRFPVIHSTIKSTTIDKLVKDTVMSTPWVDYVWLPGRFFDSLWRWTRETVDPNRLAKLRFSFAGRYESLADGYDDLPENELTSDTDDDIDFDDRDEPIREMRRSHFEVADRVGVLDEHLQQMRLLHDPLQSTVRIRIPSGVRGGHEIYHFGKITNRSVSFAEQQKIVRLVTSMYKRVTEDTEKMLWYSTAEEADRNGVGFTGLPVVLAFPRALDLATLHRWADRTFGNRRNTFRLGGEPMWSGTDATRLHVYGIDRHLWQPISLEATRDHILVILPRGTCGNTVNRLITNVQRFLSPSVQTWIGDRPYEDMLPTALSEEP